MRIPGNGGSEISRLDHETNLQTADFQVGEGETQTLDWFILKGKSLLHLGANVDLPKHPLHASFLWRGSFSKEVL